MYFSVSFSFLSALWERTAPYGGERDAWNSAIEGMIPESQFSNRDLQDGRNVYIDIIQLVLPVPPAMERGGKSLSVRGFYLTG